MRLISRTALLEIVPYTIQHIYRLEKAGKFPKHVRVGENRVAWVYAEVIDWIQERTEQRQLPSDPKPLQSEPSDAVQTPETANVPVKTPARLDATLISSKKLFSQHAEQIYKASEVFSWFGRTSGFRAECSI